MTTDAYSGVIPEIQLGGAKPPGDLVGMRIERAMNLVGRAVIRYAPLPADWKLGSGPAFDDIVTVKATSLKGDAETLFKGYVTGIQVEQHSGVRELVITVDDAGSKLVLGSQMKTFLQRSVKDVVTEIAAAVGLRLDSKISDSTAVPYYLESGTDLEFLGHLAARAGVVWWVQPDDTLRWESADIAEGAVSLRIDDGDDFSVRATDLKPSTVRVTGWDIDRQEELIGEASVKDAARPTLPHDFPRATGTKKLVVRDASPVTQEEAKALAASVAATTASQAVQARGEVAYVPGLAPAVSVAVTGTGMMDGSFRLTEVTHVYSRATGLRVRFVSGPVRPSGLVDLLPGQQRSGGHRIDGVLPGVVTSVKDPTNQGRVKVKYSNYGAEVESPWARVATIGGGPGRGLEFQPEVDDEVLIAFELGDLRRPVILGGLFSQKNKLPTSPHAGNVVEGKIAYRRFTTRLGHVLELADGDQDAQQHVLIKLGTKKDQIRLGGDKTEITVDKRPVTITNGKATISFTEAGDVTIEGVNVTIKAQQALKLEGGTSADLKAGTEAKVEGPKVTVKGQTNTEVSGGVQLALKGGMVMIN
jgi:uncharacterized protein involved in type VI secretion and phage assembly